MLHRIRRRLWILFTDFIYACLTRFVLDSEKMYGIRVWGLRETLQIMRREIGVVYRFRPSALRRLARARTEIFCGPSTFAMSRRNIVCVKSSNPKRIAWEVVGVARAMQLFPLARASPMKYGRVASIVANDVLILMRRLVRSQGGESVEISRSEREYLRTSYVADLWKESS
jgi:hypothetical protein